MYFWFLYVFCRAQSAQHKQGYQKSVRVFQAVSHDFLSDDLAVWNIELLMDGGNE